MKIISLSIIDPEEEGYSDVMCSFCKRKRHLIRVGFRSDLKPVIHNEECFINLCEACALKKAERYCYHRGKWVERI